MADKKRDTLDALIPVLDENTFAQFAGLFNARALSAPVSVENEVRLLLWVLREEYRRTGRRELIQWQTYLGKYLQ